MTTRIRQNRRPRFKRPGLGQSQESEPITVSHMGAAAHARGPSSAFLPGALAGSWMGSSQTRTASHMDASNVGCSLTCCTTSAPPSNPSTKGSSPTTTTHLWKKCFVFKVYLLVYLKGRVTESASLCWFSPQLVVPAAGQDEARIQVAGDQMWAVSCCLPRAEDPLCHGVPAS